jgi:hypothetical protein
MKNFKDFLEEQLDELNTDTLKKYKTAAHKSVGDAAVKRHAGEMGRDEYRKNQDKRSKGINRADKRLGTYADKTPKKLDISGSGNDIQKKYHSGASGSRMSEDTNIEEGLKPEHNMRPGWMIKADPVLKAKIAANKAKQKEMKSILGKKLKEDNQIAEAEAPLKHHSALVSYHKVDDKNRRYEARFRTTHNAGKEETEKRAKAAFASKGKIVYNIVHEEVDLNEGAYEKSEENKRSADSAKKQGDMFAHHLHMADHHDNLAEWHASKGRHGEADKHAEKAEEHQELAMKHKDKPMKEELVVEEKHRVQVTVSDPNDSAVTKRKEQVQKFVRIPAEHSKEEAIAKAKAHFKKGGYKVHSAEHVGMVKEEVEQIDELSNEKLGQYKKAAGEDASKQDKAGNFEKGHKRFKGIMKATFKQFANDAKK